MAIENLFLLHPFFGQILSSDENLSYSMLSCVISSRSSECCLFGVAVAKGLAINSVEFQIVS